jgi:hypothetical protein
MTCISFNVGADYTADLLRALQISVLRRHGSKLGLDVLGLCLIISRSRITQIRCLLFLLGAIGGFVLRRVSEHVVSR